MLRVRSLGFGVGIGPDNSSEYLTDLGLARFTFFLLSHSSSTIIEPVVNLIF